MKPIDLSIIIVNYNTKDITLNCLKAVFASKTHYTYEVIVVDNASSDGSVPAFKKTQWPLTLIANAKNGGFANANNIGAHSASGKYIWLLNSDTIIQPTTIEQLMTLAIKHNSYLATCTLLNPDGSIQPQGGALPTLPNITTWMLNLDVLPFIRQLIPPYQLSQPYPSQPQLGWAGGTALLVRRDLYHSLRGLDEHIFMYGEDVEFCFRASQGFIHVDYFPQPKLVHLGQASGSSERAILGEFSGLKYIFNKHKPYFDRVYLKFILKCGCFFRTVIYSIKGDKKRRDMYAKALKMV